MTQHIIEYIADVYGIEPELLFLDSPNTAIFRNRQTKKWFGVLMGKMSKRKLGINSDETVDFLNLKCEPLFVDSLVDNKRIFRGYHMNKEHWISVLLDGSVESDELHFLIETSYRLVERKIKKRSGKHENL